MNFFTKPLFFKALCLTLFCITNLSAQNLVLNPSFENAPPSNPFFTCPGYGDLVDWDGVDTDTCASSDLYAPACTPLVFTGAPTNSWGTQVAHTGNNYAGIFLIDGSSATYREYLQGKLSTPLVAGQHYCVSFYVSLPEKSYKSKSE